MINLTPTITLIDDIERKHDEILNNLHDDVRRERDAVSLRDLLDELFTKNDELKRIRGRRTRGVGSKNKKKNKKRTIKGKKS